MKKNILIINSIVLVIIILGIIIAHFETNEYIILNDGTLIALAIDGVSSRNLPTSGGYKADITCENANAVWKYNEDNSEWEIELSDITGSVTCYAEFTSLTDADLVVNYIEDLLGNDSSVTSGTGYLVNEGYESSDSVGLRYEGGNPNNYVWFNNELWRIIGIIPTVVDEDGATENLVKIIRSNDIGSYVYDRSQNGVWGSNQLYTLLNTYYWEKSNGSGTVYCQGFSGRYSHCDYSEKGIGSTSYYGSMVQYVYWNVGESDYNVTPATAYSNEVASQTVGGYVGIMNASDYGYSLYANHSNYLSSYDNDSSLNWLYRGGYTYTMTVCTDTNQVLIIGTSGNMYCHTAHDLAEGFAVLPVVYLSSDVYIVDGDGSVTDPYILGTN